jgi:hypothetical protein
VAAAVASVLRGGIVVFEREDARVGPGGTPTRWRPPVAAVAALARQRPLGVHFGHLGVRGAGPARKLLGSMVLTGRPELGDDATGGCSSGPACHALLFLLRRSVAAAEEEVRGDLLTGPADRARPQSPARCWPGPGGSASTSARRTPC